MKNKKDAEIVDKGKLMDDETKEIVHIGFETYKRIIDLSGGFHLLIVILLTQFAAEYFKVSAQSAKNEWGIKDE